MAQSTASSMPPANLLSTVLSYHQDYGWSLIPVDPETKKPCLRSWKQYQTRRPTKAELSKWFSGGKYTGLAVICGAVSGNLCVLDLDTPEACEWWTTNHSDKPLPTAKTRNGRHIFMRCTPFRKQNGRGLDLLSEGAYAVLPPAPGRAWLTPPNGKIPVFDPFTLGLDHFGIRKEKNEAGADMASDSSDSSTSSVNPQSLQCPLLTPFDDDVQCEIERAIAETLPEEPGEREKRLFLLCRWLRGVFPLDGKPISYLRPTVEKWHALALPFIGTKPFEDTWQAFVRAWNRVQRPRWDVLLKFAVKEATQDTENPPNEYETESTRFLLRVCYQIQRRMGRTPFGFSCRMAGDIIDVSSVSAAGKLEMFVADGYLGVAEQYRYGTRRATRYRYIGARKEHESR
jgi:hypothetical protein